MTSTTDLIVARRSQLATTSDRDPYRVVVKRVDGSRETYEYRTLSMAQEMFFGAWRKTRSGPKPTAYSVAIEERDGDAWRPLTRSVPNQRQMRARHDHLAAELR